MRLVPTLRATAVLLATACSDATPVATPLGETLLIVDTDAPVPKLVSRLRVDLYTTDGTWYASRDTPLDAPADWPVSFAVSLQDGAPAREVVVRLRAYPDGHVRDDTGEVYEARPTLCGGVACTAEDPAQQAACCPLFVGKAPQPLAVPWSGSEAPPSTEPTPTVTIDRLVLLDLEPGSVAQLHVVLAGACFGTMADLRDFTQLATCVDAEGALVAVSPAATGVVPVAGGPSQVGAFEARYTPGCSVTPRAPGLASDGTPLHDGEACVQGGSFILGGRAWFNGSPTDELPERVALVPSFLLDRYEFTVARLRDALARGYGGTTPLPDEGPLGGTDDGSQTWCTWSSAPRGREELPINCVDEATARALCVFEGGDLPSEVQWEYAAAIGGRSFQTHFPWGDATPSCSTSAFERSSDPTTPLAVCTGTGIGPTSVTAFEAPGGDVTASGIVDLGGNVGEWTAAPLAPLSANCWLAAPLESPACVAPGAPTLSARGGSWAGGWPNLIVVNRTAVAPANASPEGGFRCSRPGSAP